MRTFPTTAWAVSVGLFLTLEEDHHFRTRSGYDPADAGWSPIGETWIADRVMRHLQNGALVDGGKRFIDDGTSCSPTRLAAEVVRQIPTTAKVGSPLYAMTTEQLLAHKELGCSVTMAQLTDAYTIVEDEAQAA